MRRFVMRPLIISVRALRFDARPHISRQDERAVDLLARGQCNARLKFPVARRPRPVSIWPRRGGR